MVVTPLLMQSRAKRVRGGVRKWVAVVTYINTVRLNSLVRLLHMALLLEDAVVYPEAHACHQHDNRCVKGRVYK